MANPFEAEKIPETVSASAEKTRKIKEAMTFLQAALAFGARPAAEVEAAARAAGISHTTLQTARERLHISSARRGNRWIWTPARQRQKQHTH